MYSDFMAVTRVTDATLCTIGDPHVGHPDQRAPRGVPRRILSAVDGGMR